MQSNFYTRLETCDSYPKHHKSLRKVDPVTDARVKRGDVMVIL